MNKTIYLGLAVALSVLATSCYKDKSMLATKTIPEALLDTTGMSGNIYIGYQETLKLAPKATGLEGRNLAYQWAISEKVHTERSTDLKVIGESLELDYKVERPIASTPYWLRLTVTDKDNGGLQTIYSWRVYVQSAYITGLAVANTRDGKTTNISYAKNKNVSTNYKGEQVVIQDLLTDETKIDGLVSSLWYTSLGRQWSKHTSQLWAVTKEGKAVRFNTQDFSLNGHSDKTDLILYKPEGFQFRYLFKGGNLLFANTTKGIYSLLSESINIFSTPDVAMEKQHISEDIVACDYHSNSSINNLVWFDDKQGSFLAHNKPQSSFEVRQFTKTDAFDPNDLKGRKALAGAIAYDRKHVSFLLKEESSGAYTIYYMTQGTAREAGVAKGSYKIPEAFKAKMDAAKSFFFSKRNNILYVASGNAIYAVTFGSGAEATPHDTPIYTLPSGETLQSAKLFVQGQYMARADEVEYKFVPVLSYNLNALTIVSHKGNEYEGVVRVVELAGGGEKTNPEGVNTFEGFGKILDVIGIGM